MAAVADAPRNLDVSSIDEEKKIDPYNDVNIVDAEGDLDATEQDIAAAQAEAEKMTFEEARLLVQEIVDEYRLDPNFPPNVMDACVLFLTDESMKEDPVAYRKLLAEIKLAASFLRDNSPYPEVRAVVSNTDDPTLPVSTLRAWVIGLILACGGAAINIFFAQRFPGITLSVYAAQVLAYPVGAAWARFVPNLFSIPIPFSGGQRLELNPGPFNQKEHMLITIMANVSYATLYTTDIYIIQRLPIYFNQPWASNYGYQVTTSMAVQLMGYGLAGITRRFLVYPASCIWPTNLGTIALNRAFHRERNVPANGWHMTRLRFFLYTFIAMFVYYWFPNTIFAAMSLFNWATWAAPNNINLAALTGTWTGLGLIPISTLDWNWQVEDPIITPLFAVLNQMVGALIAVPIIAAIWYSNSFNTGYFPINSNHVFDNTGAFYNVSQVLTPDGLFDEAAYEAYSPAYLAAGNMVVYTFFFALYTATISYAFLYHRHDIVRGFRAIWRRSPNDGKDIHNRLMRVYPEAPDWWYAVLLLISVALALAGLLAYPTHASVSSIFFGIALTAVLVVPIGIITSVTNLEVTLNVISEFIGGAAYPGNYLSMLYFKTFGVITASQAISFAQDLKLGHYSKIPPRIMFFAQTVATIITTFVQISIVNWQITNVKQFCEIDQPEKLICPSVNTFFTAAVLWGTIGPKRIFAVHKIYNPLLWGFFVGLFLPIPFYFYIKRNPRSWVRYIHIPAMLFGAIAFGAPYNLSYAWPTLFIALFFNLYIRRRYLAWWSKYAYILTTSFSVAIAISAIIQFPIGNAGLGINWWGNTVSFEGLDYNGGTPRLTPPADPGYFGAAPGHF